MILKGLDKPWRPVRTDGINSFINGESEVKRSIFVTGILVFLLAACGSAFAIGNIYVDGIGAFTQTGDAENQYGGGFGLLYEIGPGINFFVKNIFNFRKMDPVTTSTGKKHYDEYRYFMNTAGVEYLYNIENLPLFWKSSLGIGAGTANIQADYDELISKYKKDAKDTGICFSLTTGALYVLTQSISAFLDVGYHKTYFSNDLKDASIMGFQVNIGVRFTAWGINRSIYSEY